jgi:hypothetical protein
MSTCKTIHCMTAGLLLSVAALAQEVTPPDRSLSSLEYVELGLPSKDRVWDGDDLVAAAEALKKLAERDPSQLPRVDSPRSGAVFARLTAAANLEVFADPALPLDQRVHTSLANLKGTGELLKVYLGTFLKQATGAEELAELVGAQLRSTRALLGLVPELLQRIDPDAPDYQIRMGGLDQMRRGLATMLAGVLSSLRDKKTYSSVLRIRLVGYLDETLPAMIPHLTPDSQAETVRQLETMVKAPELEDLRAPLTQLLEKAREAAKTHRPNGPGEPSPGLRPQADALGRKGDQPPRPERPREFLPQSGRPEARPRPEK